MRARVLTLVLAAAAALVAGQSVWGSVPGTFVGEGAGPDALKPERRQQDSESADRIRVSVLSFAVGIYGARKRDDAGAVWTFWKPGSSMEKS